MKKVWNNLLDYINYFIVQKLKLLNIVVVHNHNKLNLNKINRQLKNIKIKNYDNITI